MTPEEIVIRKAEVQRRFEKYERDRAWFQKFVSLIVAACSLVGLFLAFR